MSLQKVVELQLDSHFKGRIRSSVITKMAGDLADALCYNSINYLPPPDIEEADRAAVMEFFQEQRTNHADLLPVDNYLEVSALFHNPDSTAVKCRTDRLSPLINIPNALYEAWHIVSEE